MTLCIWDVEPYGILEIKIKRKKPIFYLDNDLGEMISDIDGKFYGKIIL